ncbi:MAG TPA: PIG-L family deacetylase, partial [Vicinamibacterales bacterium]|nr:PIG-L family deacetylase [Vicinamibacterales bacterium]
MSARFRFGSPLLVVVLAILFFVPTSPSAQLRVAPVGERPGDASLELLLRKLTSTGTFMQTDAHPDDEDNGLLAMLGLGEGMRTVLVTATRGDGGQNEIGPELFQALGVLRTEELLAVHRFDGAEQYFTRAIDFGYSFSVDESIEKWGREAIVGDFVRHIRTVRPDVIAGFLCGGEGGGQHHQASAKLTLEAFRAAADPAKYPEQIAEGLRPWQALRIFCTDVTAFTPNPPPPGPDMLKVDVSGFDPVLGRTYAELGLEARSMHKCQGTSQLLLLPGQSQNRTYKLWDSTLDARGVAPKALFAGIDTSLHGLLRFTNQTAPPEIGSRLDAIASDVSAAERALKTSGPAAAVPPLAAGLRAVRDLRRSIASAGARIQGAYEIEFRLAQKERQFEDALLVAAGTRLDALADDGVVTAGQGVNVSVYATAGAAPVALRSATLAGFDGALSAPCQGSLENGAPVICKGSMRIPTAAHVSTPYWTPRKDAARYDFDPDVPFGVPFRPSPFVATFALSIGGVDVTADRTVQYRYSNLVAGEKRTQLNVSPSFNVRVDPDIAVFPVGNRSPKTIAVTVGNNQKAAASATVSLRVPAGWTVQPASAPLSFSREDDEITEKFTVGPPAGVTPGEFSVSAVVAGAGGAESHIGYEVVEYPHIHRRQVVQDAATRVKVL